MQNRVTKLHNARPSLILNDFDIPYWFKKDSADIDKILDRLFHFRPKYSNALCSIIFDEWLTFHFERHFIQVDFFLSAIGNLAHRKSHKIPHNSHLAIFHFIGRKGVSAKFFGFSRSSAWNLKNWLVFHTFFRGERGRHHFLRGKGEGANDGQLLHWEEIWHINEAYKNICIIPNVNSKKCKYDEIIKTNSNNFKSAKITNCQRTKAKTANRYVIVIIIVNNDGNDNSSGNNYMKL